MVVREVHQPVVDSIRNVKLSQFIQKCRVQYSIKSFGEVQVYDDDVWFSFQEVDDGGE